MNTPVVGLQTQIWNNNLKSVLLLIGFPFLFLLMTWAFFTAMGFADARPHPFEAGWEGFLQYWHIPLMIALVWLLIAGLFHQRLIEAATGAKPVTRKEQPELYNLLENLCISRGLAMPKLCIVEDEALNAFASGISNKSYTITVTRGLLNTLNAKELEAVLGHELTHIRNNDVRLMIIAIVFVGIISFACEMIFRSIRYSSFRSGSARRGRGGGGVILIAGIILAIGYGLAIVIRFALSRRREYLADEGSVELTKNPDNMISALQKISGHAEMKHVPSQARQMMIENPPEIFSLFSTHPAIEDRIASLVAMGGREPVSAQPPSGGPWG